MVQPSSYAHSHTHNRLIAIAANSRPVANTRSRFNRSPLRIACACDRVIAHHKRRRISASTAVVATAAAVAAASTAVVVVQIVRAKINSPVSLYCCTPRDHAADRAVVKLSRNTCAINKICMCMCVCARKRYAGAYPSAHAQPELITKTARARVCRCFSVRARSAENKFVCPSDCLCVREYVCVLDARRQLRGNLAFWPFTFFVLASGVGSRAHVFVATHTRTHALRHRMHHQIE